MYVAVAKIFSDFQAGGAGARSQPVGSVTVYLAVEEVIEKGKRVAAQMLGAGEEDILQQARTEA